ncbi:MAG TPA: rhodanese-like domain-containing protein [Anaerolineaceae bacterium]|nr:rhodanese-like domain-containing protein [Anaerolineaceae bacterium]
MKVRWIWLVILLALALAGCGGENTDTEGGYRNISVDDLDAMLADKDFVLVNTHIPFEGDIPGTDLSIPYNEIGQRLDELPAKDAAIVLYCRSGNMSTTAAERLVELGYTNLYELDGGFDAWEAAGLPLEK